jgi:hypothetical protein
MPSPVGDHQLLLDSVPVGAFFVDRALRTSGIDAGTMT